MNDNINDQSDMHVDPGKKKGFKLRAKLALIFITVMIIPVAILTVVTWHQITSLGYLLRDTVISDAKTTIHNVTRDSLEKVTADTAARVAAFLYQCDQDLLLLSKFMPSDEAFKIFSESRYSSLMTSGEWKIADDGMSWVEVDPPEFFGHSQKLFPLYDEITLIDLDGQELFKYVNSDTTKANYPMNPEKLNISDKANTYIGAETYWEKIQELQPGEVYVSDLTGTYVSTNYIGMYTPGMLGNSVTEDHPDYVILQEIAGLSVDKFIETAKQQAFAGMENPVGQRFEGIVRRITPITGFDGEIWGYLTMALNHDHVMEIVDQVTPAQEQYTVYSDAHDGNYVFVWDYEYRIITHPRHHFIAGYNPLTEELKIHGPEDLILMEHDHDTGRFTPDERYISKPINYSKGFGFVTIGSGIENFTESTVLMEKRLDNFIDENSHNNLIQLIITNIAAVILALTVAMLLFTSKIIETLEKYFS